jgi:tRNA(fMet)-specific endonuclease VapC
MDESLLDTDLLSEVLKGKDAQVLANARRYLSEHQRLAFSDITLYEIVRGMRDTRAVRQLASFLKTVDTSNVFPVSRQVLLRAADLWSEARRRGHPKDDADLIVAATALEAGRVLVTGNTTHFSWIPGLRLSDWRKPAATKS